MKSLDNLTLLLEAEVKDRSANSMDKITLNRLAQIAKGNTDRLNQKKESTRKESAEEFGTKTKAIKNCKVKVFNELVEFLNFCSGVGLNGDKSLKREVETEKFDYENRDGKAVPAFRGSKWPSEADFNKAKANVLKEVEQLKKYEDALDKEKDQGIARKILSIVNRVYYDQLDFDTPEKDMHGKMRLNADIFDDLYPILGNLRKSAIPNNLVKNIANKFGDEEDYGLQKLRNVMGRNIVKDQLSNRSENAKGRYKRMRDAIYDEKEYGKIRKMEQGIDGVASFAKQRNEIAAKAKTATSAEEKEAIMKQSRKDYDASRFAARNLMGTQSGTDFLTDNGVDKLTNKKATAILDKWIKGNAPKDDAHKIKVYGSINGRSEQGLLAFIPGEKSTYGDKGIKLDGANAFRLVKTFFEKLTDEQKEYVEDNRKNAAWKAKVNKILVKAGICTEGFDFNVDGLIKKNIFNY